MFSEEYSIWLDWGCANVYQIYVQFTQNYYRLSTKLNANATDCPFRGYLVFKFIFKKRNLY